MELEELKHIFLQQAIQHPVKSSTEALNALLKRKSVSQTAKLKKNLVAELVIASIFTTFPAYILLSYQGKYIMALAILFLIIAVLFIWKIISLLSAIKRYETTTFVIKQRLQLLIDILNNSARLYIQSTIVIFPIMFGVAALLIHLDNQDKDPLLFHVAVDNTLATYFTASLAWCIIMFFFTKWYVKKFYGSHIKRLKSHLNEITSV